MTARSGAGAKVEPSVVHDAIVGARSDLHRVHGSLSVTDDSVVTGD